MFSRNTIKLEPILLERAKAAAVQAGYSSVEEFIGHAIEKELIRIEEAEGKAEVIKQLKGLGYLE
jgi:hypothetical protein